jgi:hypothetical protein
MNSPTRVFCHSMKESRIFFVSEHVLLVCYDLEICLFCSFNRHFCDSFPLFLSSVSVSVLESLLIFHSEKHITNMSPVLCPVFIFVCLSNGCVLETWSLSFLCLSCFSPNTMPWFCLFRNSDTDFPELFRCSFVWVYVRFVSYELLSNWWLRFLDPVNFVLLFLWNALLRRVCPATIVEWMNEQNSICYIVVMMIACLITLSNETHFAYIISTFVSPQLNSMS